MSRIVRVAILVFAVAAFGAGCQDDANDGGDTGVIPTLPAIALDLRDALPSTAEVDAAFGAQEERYTKGNPWGFITDLLSGRPGVDDQLAIGLVGAYWTVYSPGLGPDPGPGAGGRREAADGRWEIVQILRARPSENPTPPTVEPGTIDARLYVAARDGFVEILEIKPCSGRTMGWQDYVNGRHVAQGDRFSTPSQG